MPTTDLTRSAIAALGAIIFTATTVVAAVAPARVAETSRVVYADGASAAEARVDA